MAMRATGRNLEERVGLVRRLLVVGMGHRRLREVGRALWGVGRVQMWRYMKRAYADWARASGGELPEGTGMRAAQKQMGLRRAMEVPELRAALSRLKNRDPVLKACAARARERERTRLTLAELLREVARSQGRRGCSRA